MFRNFTHQVVRKIEHAKNLIWQRLLTNKDHLLPFKSFEVMESWDLGGDGKTFFGFHPEEEWYIMLMRKWVLEVMSIIENGNHLPRILAKDSRSFVQY